MMEDPVVAAAQAECALAMVAMVEAVVPCMEYLEAHVPAFETDDARAILDRFRQNYDRWMLAGAHLATVQSERRA